MYLRELTFLQEKIGEETNYPHNIQAFRSIEQIRFESNVTFFVGENGSGKSTLLEAIADKCDFHTAGGSRNNIYEVDASQSHLSKYIRLSWLPKMTDGFFLRAESFYHFASYLDQLAREDRAFHYQGYGGKSLHEQSHGESFLTLFTNRFDRKGIYLLDEPEAALSPARQLSLLSIIHELKEYSQFIIATHSPILLGFPMAQILSFDTSPISTIDYEQTSHYQITRRFLENREVYFKELFD
ncbi:AAA family ATPase [Cytobacillus sp. Hm23]